MQPRQPIRRSTIEDALDDALRETFPCSDPIAVSCLVERESAREVILVPPAASLPNQVKHIPPAADLVT